MIANSESLKSLSTYLPLTKTDLAKISGFGKAKVEKYGDDIIEMITDYCERNGLDSNMQFNTAPAKKERVPKKPKEDTKKISFDLYKTGLSIGAIATERKFTVQTIEGHLAHYIETGDISIDELLSGEKQRKIKSAFESNPEADITKLKELLPDMSFGELKLMIAALKKSPAKSIDN